MQRKLFIFITALLMIAGVNSFAAKIIYGNPASQSADIAIPAEYVGMTASFIATGYGHQGGSNMGFSMTLYHPDGRALMNTPSHYITAGDSSATDMFPFLYTETISQAGTYSFRLENTYDQKKIMSFLCIIWDAPGDDLTALQSQLNMDLDALRNDLNGELNTRTAELEGQIGTLQTQLNDLIIKHDSDQAALLKQIQDFKDEIHSLVAELQYNVARLERQQAEYLAQLEVLRIAYEKDIEMLNLKISNLDSKYALEVANIKSDVAAISSDLEAMDAKFLAADQQLKTLIVSLENQQDSLQQQLNLAEQKHNSELTALQDQIDAKTELIRTEHTADVERLENSIDNVDTKYETEATRLNTELIKTNNELAAAISDYTSADSALQSKVDKLTSGQTSLQSELFKLTSGHNRDIAELENKIETADSQLLAQHNADVKLFEQSISDLDSRYRLLVDSLTAALNQTNIQLTQAVRDSNDADSILQGKIDLLTQQQTAQKNALALLESEHNKDVAALRAESTARYEQLQTKHDSDVSALTQQINNLNSTYADKVSQINNELDSISFGLMQLARDYSDGDKELKEQIDTLRLQQLTQQNTLNNLKESHAQDVTTLQKELAAVRASLDEKINLEVADIRQDMLALDNKYKDATADLKDQLSDINTKLENEIFKLSETDRDLYEKISELREKQADYYARIEILKVTHEKDKEAIEKEIADFDAKYKAECAAINVKIASVKEDVSALEDKHKEDVNTLQGQIDFTVDKLDDEVKNIYIELSSVKEQLAAHQTATQKSIDNLQLQITEIDKSVTERLTNLENRIRYAVYSDEKLEALKKDFEAQIQAKEKEIADLDLEIQNMANAGLDTSAKETTRTRLLTELLKLRNELTDIEFAITIRHDESEFAEHEKEIALLKTELSELRSSTDLQIKQLKDDLLSTEEKYLKLLEEAKSDASNQTAAVQKQLDELKNQVLAFVETLRDERESGDSELKTLLVTMDASHKELVGNLDKSTADKLDKLKFETDTQFENLRSTINNLAYQQRAATGGSGASYSLPGSQVKEVPADTRDMRVSPDAALDSNLN